VNFQRGILWKKAKGELMGNEWHVGQLDKKPIKQIAQNDSELESLLSQLDKNKDSRFEPGEVVDKDGHLALNDVT
jgi:hypothetical protein